MEHPKKQIASTRSLCYGTFAWVAFSIIAVAIRGVRWEETYEHALIITRLAPYPEGHPCFQYCRNVFSGQSYLSALLLHFIDSPLLINGLRNVLQLVFCTVPVFLLGARFSGKARYGHIAVVLVLLGIHRGLQSYYPIESWPHMYAIGQIGTGYALFVLALLLYGCWRTVWLLLGLMVAIHVGQLPIIGAVAGVQWLRYLYQGNRQRVVQALGYFSLGLVPCILLFAVMTRLHVPLPTEGAYAATGDVHAIWAAYTERYDLHRGFARLNPFWKSWIGVVLVLFLAGLRACGERRRAIGEKDHGWVGLYGIILSVVVGGIWLTHQAMGGDIPFLLLGWMPYRLTNHLAILLVPLAIGVLAHTPPGRDRPRYAPRVFLFGVLLWLAMAPLWSIMLPEVLYTRYAGNLDTGLWLLSGGALITAIHHYRKDGGPLLAPLLLTGTGIAVLVYISPYAAVIGLVAMTACGLLLWAEALCERMGPIEKYLAIVSAILLIGSLIQQATARQHLPVHPLQQEVMDYLTDRGESDAMLVLPYWDVAWLAKTRHPVFADYQTAHHMTYMRSLAPSLKKMHADIYGFSVDGDAGTPLAPWPKRSAAEWRTLAEAYEFDYVLAPSEMALALTPVLKSHPYTLYRAVP
ncbi:MAG: hypothetical protein L3K26_07895 [Candidatus Hydrogenedentes bacterium]|nr:hypothetical protein [Candidatus Hydrogenedentota bacterium]